MARENAEGVNAYADNLNSLEPALHSAFVDVAGVVGWSAGPRGSAAAAGLIEGEITYIETGDAKTASIAAARTGVTTLLLGKAVGVGGKLVGTYIIPRVSGAAAKLLAGAGSQAAASGEKYSSQEFASYEEYLAAKEAGANAANQAGQSQIDGVISRYGLGKHLGGKRVVYAGEGNPYTLPSGGVDPSDPNTIKIYSQGLANGDRGLVETMIEEIHHSKTLARNPSLGTRANNVFWNNVVEPRARKYAAKYARRLGL